MNSHELWTEIHGFNSPGDYASFESSLERLVDLGKLEEIPADPTYGPGMIYGGRWFLQKSTGKLWRLVGPDFPFKGLWEPIR